MTFKQTFAFMSIKNVKLLNDLRIGRSVGRGELNIESIAATSVDSNKIRFIANAPCYNV